MKKPFIDALQERIFLTDGGIGTEIYSQGFYVNRCYDHLNLAEPVTIRKIHEINFTGSVSTNRCDIIYSSAIQA